MGSVAERVVRVARCPVFVVRPKGHPEVEELEESNDGGLAARDTYQVRKGAPT
jgi:hypothetical protein